MRLFVLVLLARLRVLGRFLSANAFVVFVLGPLLIGAALWIVDRYLPKVRDPLADLLAGGSPGPLGLALALAMTGLTVPAVTRELFPTRAADGVLDVLPVPEAVRFPLSLAAVAARLLLLAALLAVVLVALSGWRWTLAAGIGPRLAAAVLTLAPLALLAAAGRVRLLGTPGSEIRAAMGLAVALGGVLLLEPATRLVLLTPWWSAAAQLEAALGAALALSAAPAGLTALAATVLVLGLASAGLVLGFRRRDLERAESLVWRRRGRSRRVRLGRRPVGAQLTRDLRLVARRFSPAVVLAAAVALVFVAAAVLVVPSLGLKLVVTQRITIATTLGAVLSLSALVPLVLRHQLPRFWIEKSTPVRWEEVWLAKAWLAPLLASPAAAAGAAALVVLAAEHGGAGLGTALLQLAAAAWVIASVVGLSAFEIAEQPVLGLIFSAMVSLAIAALFLVAPQVWWMWTVLWAAVAGKLAERATQRVRLMEIER